jgi:helicase
MIYDSYDNEKHIKTTLEVIKRGEYPTISDLKELLERSYQILRNDDYDDYKAYNLGLSSICHVANLKPEDGLIQALLHECVVQSRVFLYNQMILSSKNVDVELVNYDLSVFDEFTKEFYTLENSETVLTRDQKRLFEKYQASKRLIISAPTSFGKSRIVQEIIIHNKYKNLLIVLPTIALLNETFVRFKSNPLISNRYQLYNSLGNREVTFKEEGNIFILTPEKTDLLLDQHQKIKFDFFTMDEIYKIQDGDDRSKVFTNCLYRLSKIEGINFYLIGPYFSGFSKIFQEKTNSTFILYESEIVQKDDLDISKIEPGTKYKIEKTEIKKLKSEKLNLRNVIRSISGQSLVYRGRKKYYTEITANYLIDFAKRSDLYSDLIEYIEDNISKEWSMVKCLRSGIAFHHGALPKYIQTEIIEQFNAGDLDTIVCTSTIVEGVNTTAKNVIIYDQYKGEDILSGFDVKNIKGRAGRFLSHFIGNIYSLVPLKLEENKGEIEFSFYDENNLDQEDTLQINKEDLAGQNLQKRLDAEAYLRANNIPLSVIRSNKFISIHKQVSLINSLRENLFLIDDLYYTSNRPTKDQLYQIIILCHDHLFTEKDRDDHNYTIGQLIRLTQYYVYNRPSLKELIDSHDKSDNIDTKVRNAFNLMSHYFEFSLPKYLTAFENLYNFVYKEMGRGDKGISLAYLITILEFGHSEEHEIALKEAGLPNEIIKKVSVQFSDCSTIEQIRIKIAIDSSLISHLTTFERKIFSRYI